LASTKNKYYEKWLQKLYSHNGTLGRGSMGALGGLKVDTREIVLPLIIGKQNEHSTQCTKRDKIKKYLTSWLRYVM
jgi:hypothetical protein